ncbi:MAG: 4Fe-4S dicluster domain-containing protein [Chloroflexota bacterium]|nr:4Fe-4S dicluster domain-containing protein [Chloroflexota bacterium]
MRIVTDPIDDRPGSGARLGAMGFLTDTTLCIGCKACEVACKQWNGLPADGYALSGKSYDNTVDLGASSWRHVAFVEQSGANRATLDGWADPTARVAWLMLSDVCKHCVHAGCLDACPTGAIVRTEFDSVYIQQDICNGCGYCVPACPFGVPQLSETAHTAKKCTLCYDRISNGLQPACATACPTASIRFGPIETLLPEAYERVETLRELGVSGAQVYGDRASGGTGGMDGLNALFVLTASPETYNLPSSPALPSRNVVPAFMSTAIAALGLGLAAAVALRGSR